MIWFNLCTSRTLDYIFVSGDLKVTSAAAVPLSEGTGDTSILDLNDIDLTIAEKYGRCRMVDVVRAQDGPFPNSDWPSDHSLVEATVEIVKDQRRAEKH